MHRMKSEALGTSNEVRRIRLYFVPNTDKGGEPARADF